MSALPHLKDRNTPQHMHYWMVVSSRLLNGYLSMWVQKCFPDANGNCQGTHEWEEVNPERLRRLTETGVATAVYAGVVGLPVKNLDEDMFTKAVDAGYLIWMGDLDRMGRVVVGDLLALIMDVPEVP